MMQIAYSIVHCILYLFTSIRHIYQPNIITKLSQKVTYLDESCFV